MDMAGRANKTTFFSYCSVQSHMYVSGLNYFLGCNHGTAPSAIFERHKYSLALSARAKHSMRFSKAQFIIKGDIVMIFITRFNQCWGFHFSHPG